MSENEENALKTVKNYMWWSMGAGLIPVPFVDLAAVTGVQLEMLNELSKIYGVPFEKNRSKACVGSLLGSIVPTTLAFGTAGSMLKAIPAVGALAGAPAMVLFSGAATWAVGKVFIQHFESGGTFLNFDPDEVKAYFKAQFAEGETLASSSKKHKGEAPA